MTNELGRPSASCILNSTSSSWPYFSTFYACKSYMYWIHSSYFSFRSYYHVWSTPLWIWNRNFCDLVHDFTTFRADDPTLRCRSWQQRGGPSHICCWLFGHQVWNSEYPSVTFCSFSCISKPENQSFVSQGSQNSLSVASFGCWCLCCLVQTSIPTTQSRNHYYNRNTIDFGLSPSKNVS